MNIKKSQRQQEILKLLQGEHISNQEQLRGKLSRFGFTVTQATLSRDLKELNAVKTTSDHGSYKYTTLENWQGLPISSCQVSGNLLVFRTQAGMAPAVAYQIDELAFPAVVGTVAGEDTLLAVVAEGYDARKVRMELWQRIQAM